VLQEERRLPREEVMGFAAGFVRGDRLRTLILRGCSSGPPTCIPTAPVTDLRLSSARPRRRLRGSESRRYAMRAAVGDEIVVETTTLDTPRRRGEVVEVIGTGDREHYRVRWQDGHESICFPGPDAHVVSQG
jgi:Domain of unknown function (DUF1918)